MRIKGMGAVALATMLLAAAPPTGRQLAAGADPIAFIQGEWVSRHEIDDARISVSGNTIQMGRAAAQTSGTLKFFNPGETMATIADIKKERTDPNDPTLRTVVFNATCTGIQGQERERRSFPCEVWLVGHATTKREGKKNQIDVYYSLSVGSIDGFYRVDEKPKIFADYNAR